MNKLHLNPDRALPAEGQQRDAAREIYGVIRDLPIISMHGHVAVETFLDNRAFLDPTSLLITPDHYLCRMLYSQGYTPSELGVGASEISLDESRAIWRRVCSNWKLFRGTPTRFWLEHEFAEVFGVDEMPTAENADRLYDRISAALRLPEFRPRQLLDKFNIEIISTTDPASCDLTLHEQLRRQGLGERVLPTLRPDSAIDLANPFWKEEVDAIGELSGEDTSTYSGYLEGLRQRRFAFKSAGALATDHGPLTPDTLPLSDDEASRIYAKRLSGVPVSAAENAAFGANMLFQMAKMSTEDGLVMQIHPGVLRNQHHGLFEKFGADIGFDVPTSVDFTTALTPMLNAFGMNRTFRCILFTIDETVFSRELAPLAGAYSSLSLGAPWWFIDSPEAIGRFYAATTETAGFYNLSGFVDDTRAYCSIPARHDLFRRSTAGFLAKLVVEHRLTLEEAVETAKDLTYTLPKQKYQRQEPDQG